MLFFLYKKDKLLLLLDGRRHLLKMESFRRCALDDVNTAVIRNRPNNSAMAIFFICYFSEQQKGAENMY